MQKKAYSILFFACILFRTGFAYSVEKYIFLQKEAVVSESMFYKNFKHSIFCSIDKISEDISCIIDYCISNEIEFYFVNFYFHPINLKDKVINPSDEYG